MCSSDLGTVAMANSGPGTNGSQFFITYENTTLGPNYTIWGRVTSGLEIVKYIAEGGVVRRRPTRQATTGTARGVQFGNGLNWSYAMMLKVGDDHWKVRFDDWMFLQPGGVIINRAVVLRWGIEIGTVTIAFRRIDPGLQADKTFPAPSGS